MFLDQKLSSVSQQLQKVNQSRGMGTENTEALKGMLIACLTGPPAEKWEVDKKNIKKRS